MFEIYKAINGRKTYIVGESKLRTYPQLVSYAKRYFKVSRERLIIRQAWVYNDELYLEDPHKRRARQVTIAYIKREGEPVQI